jgi:ABC-type multidrug transport system fused ATPase/permease subunit
VSETARRYLRLLRLLSDARRGELSILVVLWTVIAVLPAATAASTAYVIMAAQEGRYAVPLLLLSGMLLLGQVAAEAGGVLRVSISAQINGAHRRRLAVLVASGPTMEKLEQSETFDLVRTATADPVDWIEKTPADGALTVLGNLIRYVGLASSAAVLAAWSPWLLPPVVFAALLVRWVTVRQWVTHFQIWSTGIAHSRQYLYWGEVATSAAEGKEIRLFGFGPWLIDQHQHHMHRHLDPVWRDDRRTAGVLLVRFLLTAVPLAAVYIAVVNQAVGGHSDIAIAAAALTAAWSVFTIMGGGGNAVDVEGAMPVVKAADDLGELLRPPATVASAALPDGDLLIRFEQVSFSYPGSASLLLDGLDLEIRPGELLAVVGLNGAGKSTLTKLLCGLYRPTSGRITVNGVDIADIPEWNRAMAVVFQDFVRYPLSLLENIALGCAAEPVDPEEIRAAARIVGIEEMAERLPLGWDTPLDTARTGGVELSGGQWQQVAMARALYAVGAGARVLVLDEPTAHLDVRSEAALFTRLTDAVHDVATVLVTHRLWTVRHSDRIVLVQDGRILEDGHHDGLMARGGEYARMYELQSERFRRGYDDRIAEGEVV